MMTIMMDPPRTRAVDWDTAYAQHGPTLTKVESFIAAAESEHALSLTPSAVSLLLTPILDELDAGRALDDSVLQASITEIFDELATAPDQRDQGAQRSSASIIRAWHLRWCKVPPFCAKP
jgi:hypothetical protein